MGDLPWVTQHPGDVGRASSCFWVLPFQLHPAGAGGVGEELSPPYRFILGVSKE